MDQDATFEIPRPITEFNLLLITPLLHPCILCGINTLHSEVGGEAWYYYRVAPTHSVWY